MHTWGLYDTLLESARRTTSRNPERASEVAGLALAVAMLLDKDTYGESLIADYKTAAMAVRGNCKRVAKDSEGARADLEAAWLFLEAGTGDALERAHVLMLGGSWNLDLGFLEKAETLLERAITIYRRAGDDSMVGRAMVCKALAIGSQDSERAIAILREAGGYINSIQEPRIELCRRHDLAWCLNETDRSMEAAAVLRDSQGLYRKFRDPKIQFRLRWLEGRIQRSLGNLGEAEKLIERAATDYLERDLRHEYFFCCLDLATVASAQGDRASALQILSSLYGLLEFWSMPAERVFVFLLLASLLGQDDI
jgi:tetratricopeptide (TPR) repeat protein